MNRRNPFCDKASDETDIKATISFNLVKPLFLKKLEKIT